MIAAAILSVLSILLVLVDGFEAMILPRRVGRKFRLTMLLYRTLWPLWRAMARTIKNSKRRHTFLSVFGPFSLLILFAMWAIALILGFGVFNWAIGTKLLTPNGAPVTLFSYLYLSGVTFFTLGFGDFTPVNTFGRVVIVAESGIGFGFLAVVIGYMPVLYQAFSKREASISLLDARAGSPPTASEILMRFAKGGAMDRLDGFLAEWERWSAELLESTISFPVLAYYRSQHDNQSWLGALTAILDTCAITIASERTSTYQARVTFAMARHAIVDICLILNAPPIRNGDDRLNDAVCTQLMEALAKAGLNIHPESGMEKLTKMRDLYEPFLNGLARRLVVTLPPIAHPAGTATDNWRSSAWTRKAAVLDRLGRESDHFD